MRPNLVHKSNPERRPAEDVLETKDEGIGWPTGGRLVGIGRQRFDSGEFFSSVDCIPATCQERITEQRINKNAMTDSPWVHGLMVGLNVD
jgi:hypothetical protein